MSNNLINNMERDSVTNSLNKCIDFGMRIMTISTPYDIFNEWVANVNSSLDIASRLIGKPFNKEFHDALSNNNEPIWEKIGNGVDVLLKISREVNRYYFEKELDLIKTTHELRLDQIQLTQTNAFFKELPTPVYPTMQQSILTFSQANPPIQISDAQRNLILNIIRDYDNSINVAFLKKDMIKILVNVAVEVFFENLSKQYYQNNILTNLLSIGLKEYIKNELNKAIDNNFY